MKRNRIVLSIILLVIIVYFLNKEVNTEAKICFAAQFRVGKASVNLNGSTVYLINKNGKVLNKTKIFLDKTFNNSDINLYNLEEELLLEGIWKSCYEIIIKMSEL